MPNTAQEPAAVIDLAALEDILEAMAVEPSGASLDVEAIKTRTVEWLSGLAGSAADFTAMLRGVFGDDIDTAAADALRTRILQKDTTWLPKVELVDSATLQSNLAAYAASNHTVYLNAELIGNNQGAARAYTEELGHHLEGLLKTPETAGDEGELFRRVMAGELLSDEQLLFIGSDNDAEVIYINGQPLEVEFWSIRGALRSAGEFISSHGAEVVGAVRTAGAAIEVGAGVAMMAGAGWTGVGAVVGGLMVAHGLDSGIAGIRTSLNGQFQSSAFQRSMFGIARGLGASETTAWQIAGGVDMAVGAALGGAGGVIQSGGGGSLFEVLHAVAAGNGCGGGAIVCISATGLVSAATAAGWSVLGAISGAAMAANGYPGASSLNQMQMQVRRGQAPKTVERVDRGDELRDRPHVHFTDGSALYQDGTWKHSSKVLSAAEKQWLTNNGWTLPN